MRVFSRGALSCRSQCRDSRSLMTIATRGVTPYARRTAPGAFISPSDALTDVMLASARAPAASIQPWRDHQRSTQAGNKHTTPAGPPAQPTLLYSPPNYDVHSWPATHASDAISEPTKHAPLLRASKTSLRRRVPEIMLVLLKYYR